MKLAATIAIAGGAAIAILANTVTVPAAVVMALVLLALTTAIVVAIRADQRRNGIPTRFASRQRSRSAATT
jgi:hypothetical protein